MFGDTAVNLDAVRFEDSALPSSQCNADHKLEALSRDGLPTHLKVEAERKLSVAPQTNWHISLQGH
eukprot:969027-Amphidinium_carterae.1